MPESPSIQRGRSLGLTGAALVVYVLGSIEAKVDTLLMLAPTPAKEDPYA